jgi:hypothetical protein
MEMKRALREIVERLDDRDQRPYEQLGHACISVPRVARDLFEEDLNMPETQSETSLPAPFSDLSRFVAKWDHPGTNPRYAMRLASTMPELQDFHDAVLPRVESIRAYLDAKSFDEYTDSDLRLARLVFAWVRPWRGVEVFKQPRVPHSKMYWDVRSSLSSDPVLRPPEWTGQPRISADDIAKTFARATMDRQVRLGRDYVSLAGHRVA